MILPCLSLVVDSGEPETIFRFAVECPRLCAARSNIILARLRGVINFLLDYVADYTFYFNNPSSHHIPRAKASDLIYRRWKS